MRPVLDSSVVLAVLLNEPGADAIDPALLAEGHLSAVNLSEIVAKLVERDATEAQVAGVLAQFVPRTHAFDASQAVAAGRLRRDTKPKGLSLGDRACLALAAALGAPAVTTDRAWAGVDVGVAVEVVR